MLTPARAGNLLGIVPSPHLEFLEFPQAKQLCAQRHYPRHVLLGETARKTRFMNQVAMQLKKGHLNTTMQLAWTSQPLSRNKRQWKMNAKENTKPTIADKKRLEQSRKTNRKRKTHKTMMLALMGARHHSRKGISSSATSGTTAKPTTRGCTQDA
jgi:electron transfer flavoprotein alpha subunit